METAESLEELVTRARERFARLHGQAARWVVGAPGRVNLIGEHIDYNDGFVMPMAIERYIVLTAAAAPSGGNNNVVDVTSESTGDRQTINVGHPTARQLPSWCSFLHGPLDLLAQRGMSTGPLAVDVVSNVPLGAGLSSSAALEVATATLVEAVTGHALDGREKARLCQKAEHDYVGMPCGIMDQFSSALCREGEAMRLDCRSLETVGVPLDDPNVAILITNSNVKHELTGSEYPARRAQCESALAKLGLVSWRDATPETLEANRGKLSDVEYERARHVIGEIARVLDFSKAAERADWNEAGRLMYASHDSLRDDYEVSCPEVDALVEIAHGIGPAGGVYGSRITGGGFGGCTVTLCRTDAAATIADRLLAEYEKRTGIRGAAFVSRPAAGAHTVTG